MESSMRNLGQGAAAKWQLKAWIFEHAFDLLHGMEALNFAVCRAAVAQNLETFLAFQQSLADSCSKIFSKISSGAPPKSFPCTKAFNLFLRQTNAQSILCCTHRHNALS